MDPIAEAARTLRRTRRHANICDVLAVLSLTGAAIVVLAGVADAMDDIPEAGWFAGAAIANGLFAFALLRAVALHLHMAVDRIMVEGVED
ncbi:hypothetical protein BH23ACT2_BH23ACT2_26450 [soil metagenome]